MHGIVSDMKTKKPIAGAWVDMWQASTNGLYEQQDKNQVDCNLRGKFKTDENGRYAFYCLRPTPYPVPDDGKYLICSGQKYWLLIYIRSRRKTPDPVR